MAAAAAAPEAAPPASDGIAAADLDLLAGPPQKGSSKPGQYCYWITQPRPKPETAQRLGLKTPRDFTREEFTKLLVDVHAECNVTLVEAACFREPHEDGEPHNNLLARSSKQYRWLPVATKLLKERGVLVNFGCNVKSWQEGVVYGRVASEHKPEEGLDQEPFQWHSAGTPTPFRDVLPKRFQKEGARRQVKMTPLAFFDACRTHGLQNTTDLWAKATELSEQGDRAMLAYLLENNGEQQFQKVLLAAGAQEEAKRQRTRLCNPFRTPATYTKKARCVRVPRFPRIPP